MPQTHTHAHTLLAALLELCCGFGFRGLFCFLLILFFERGCPSVALADLDLVVLLPQPPEQP